MGGKYNKGELRSYSLLYTVYHGEYYTYCMEKKIET